MSQNVEQLHIISADPWGLKLRCVVRCCKPGSRCLVARGVPCSTWRDGEFLTEPLPKRHYFWSTNQSTQLVDLGLWVINSGIGMSMDSGTDMGMNMVLCSSVGKDTKQDKGSGMDLGMPLS